MGDYAHQYKINSINFYPVDKSLTAQYNKIVELDTGEVVETQPENITRSGQAYENFYHIQVNYDGQIVALGDLIASLTVTEIQKVKPDFTLE